MVSRTIPVAPFDLVVFGATGDLAQRKILPGLFRRFDVGQMPPEARVIGAARSDMTAEAFRKFARKTIETYVPNDLRSADSIKAFLERLDYRMVDAQGDAGWTELKDLLGDSDHVRAFYFSVAPRLFADIAERLKRYDLATPACRIVVEKPFGRDLESARALNATLAAHFQETQIYRIDHYLGKETVQNLMAIRFGNILFEPIWNAQFIDHIQITVSETVGVGGRGEYYDRAGAMRDMMQNHLMQLLCLIAMEPPAKFDPDAVRDEKLKVIRALQPVTAQHVVRGQYLAAKEGEHPDYRTAVGDPGSRTESFVALRADVANWRWSGTPFYLRTGKRMGTRSSEIAIVFKELPHSIFGNVAPGSNRNVLSIQLQPDEGITLDVTIKEPGPGGMRLMNVPLDMSFAEALGPDQSVTPDAYERLIMDVIRGDQTLFMRGDEVEAAWAWTDPIIADWTTRGDVPKAYASGSAGPIESDELMARDGHVWRDIQSRKLRL